MRVSESDVFRELARVHKALADDTRLRILDLLSRMGELCVCELEGLLGVSQSKASRHLQTLKAAGLVSDRRDAVWVYYRLAGDLAPTARSAVRELTRATSAAQAAPPSPSPRRRAGFAGGART